MSAAAPIHPGKAQTLGEAITELEAVTRFELIDQYGRVFIIRGLSTVGLSLQDQGRTLKLFCVSEDGMGS